MLAAPQTVHGPLLAGLNPVDWAVVLVLGLSAISAFQRGLIRSVVSLVGVGAGLVMAAWYAAPFSGYVARYVRPPALAEIVAFAGVFAGVYLIASLLGSALRSASHAVGLGFVDRLGGAAFGVVRAVFVLAVALVPAMPFLPMIPYAHDSVLLPYLRTAAHGVSFVVPEDFGNRLAADFWQVQPASPAEGGFRMQPKRGRTAPQRQTEGDQP